MAEVDKKNTDDEKKPSFKKKADNSSKSKKDDTPERIAGKGTDTPVKYVDLTPTIDYALKSSIAEWFERKRRG